MKVCEQTKEQVRMRSWNYVGVAREVGGTPVVSSTEKPKKESISRRGWD